MQSDSMLNITTEEMDNLKGKVSNYKHWIGKGLYVLVSPSGKRYWRFKYIFKGRENFVSIGKYPDINVERVKEIHAKLTWYLERRINPKNIFNKQQIQNKFAMPELLKIAFKVAGFFNPEKSRQSATNAVKIIIEKLPMEKYQRRLTKRETELITYFVVNWME